MATTSYGTPMTMGMTAGMGSQPMTTTGLQAGVVRNMNLPLSRATPIQVTETTPNLEEIQNFPVAGRGLDGTHFHQDPVSGQMYVMTDEFHQRIPEILRNRITTTTSNVGILGTNTVSNGLTLLNRLMTLPIAKDEPILKVNNEPTGVSTIGGRSLSSIFSKTPENMNNTLSVIEIPIQNYSSRIYGGNVSQVPNYSITSLNKPINIINNTSAIDVFSIMLNYYKPTNLFLNTSYNQTTSTYGISYFIPVNRFINR